MIARIIEDYRKNWNLNNQKFEQIQNLEKSLFELETENERRRDAIKTHFSGQAKKGELQDGITDIPFDGYNVQVRIEGNICTEIDILYNQEK